MRIFVAAASALAAMLFIAFARPAPAADAHIKPICRTEASIVLDAQSQNGAWLKWEGEAAGRAFKALADDGFPVVGDSILALPVVGGFVLIATLDRGLSCYPILLPDAAWRALRLAVEGQPV